MRFAVPVIILLAASFPSPRASAATWQAIGPWAASVPSLALAPSQPSRVFVGLGSNGVWRSDDAGESWTWAGGRWLVDATIQALAVDPFDPDHLLAAPGNSGFLWRSFDGGANWFSVSVGSGWSESRAIVFDPLVPGRVFFLGRGGADPGVFRSTDGGTSWSHAEAGLSSATSTTGMALHPTAAGTVLLCTDEGVWRTTLAGDWWTLVRPGRSTSVDWSRSDPTRAYAATAAADSTFLAKSTDEGLTWTNTNAVCVQWEPYCGAIAVAVDPDDPEHVYLAWAVWEPGYSGRVLPRVSVTSNGGTTWALRLSPSKDQRPRGIVVDPQNPQRVWLALTSGGEDDFFSWSPDGILRSDDAGATWTGKSTGLPGDRVFAVVARAGDGYVRSSRIAGLWHSTALGEWTPRSVPDRYDGRAVSFLVNQADGVLHESDDAWDVDIGWHIQSSSTDHGQTWVSYGDWPPLNPTLRKLGVSSDDQTIYGWAYSDHPNYPNGDLYRSTSGGATFLEVASDLPRPCATVVDPSEANRLWYLAELTGEVRHSSDSGVTWDLRSTELPADPGVELVLDPSSAGGEPHLLAVYRNAGAFLSTDGAKTWSVQTSGPGVPVVAADWDPARSHMFLATEADGVWTNHLGFVNDGLTTRAPSSIRWWEAEQTLLLGTKNSSVFALTLEGVAAPEVAATLSGILAFPNPFDANTSIRFSLRAAEDVTLVIHDVTGRVVRRLFEGALAAGARSITWEGRDDAGHPVSAGIYFARLRAGREPERTVRIVRLR